MKNYDDIFKKCATLGGMYDNFDEAIDETKPEEMDAVIKASSGLKDMSEITPEMVEKFMLGKIDHINAVHDRAEEIERKKLEERVERYGTYGKKYAEEQKQIYFGMDDPLKKANKNYDLFNPELVAHCDTIPNDNYDNKHSTMRDNAEAFSAVQDKQTKKNEIDDIKDEINEIKEMMKLILLKQNNQNSVVFEK